MSARTIAEQDLSTIMEGDSLGFRWLITITDPTPTTFPDLWGLSNDIAQVIDPDTGQAVSGRMASIAIRIGLLTENGIGLPEAIADSDSKPWLVQFNDIGGTSHIFKVVTSDPDRSIGLVTCILEAYQP